METKTLELKGTEITLEDNEKNPVVNINTENADIYINGVLVWQRYEHEELAYVPVQMRNFIADHNDFIQLEDGIITSNLLVNDSSIDIYIPVNARKLITARFDLIEDMEILETDFIRNSENIDDETADKIMNKFKSLWNEIEEAAKKYNYKFDYSHSMDDGYCGGWWDIDFKRKDWNEDNFKSFSNLITKFNKYFNEVWDKYKL